MGELSAIEWTNYTYRTANFSQTWPTNLRIAPSFSETREQ